MTTVKSKCLISSFENYKLVNFCIVPTEAEFINKNKTDENSIKVERWIPDINDSPLNYNSTCSEDAKELFKYILERINAQKQRRSLGLFFPKKIKFYLNDANLNRYLIRKIKVVFSNGIFIITELVV